MFKVVSTSYGRPSEQVFDTEREANDWFKMISKWDGTTNPQIIHITDPVKPSEAPVSGSGGYRKNCFMGWKDIESSTIVRRNFKVTFECYGEPTIDMMCDALNGWYTTWTAWRATFDNGEKTIQVYTKRESVIDRLFETINDLGPDSDPEMTEEELAHNYFQRIVMKATIKRMKLEGATFQQISDAIDKLLQ